MRMIMSSEERMRTTVYCFFLRIRRQTRSTRTEPRFPYTTLFRSVPHLDTAIAAYRDKVETLVVTRSEKGALATRGDELAEAHAEPIERLVDTTRSEEHTSELQSLMRISYAVFCLKKKIKHNYNSVNTLVYNTSILQHTTEIL